MSSGLSETNEMFVSFYILYYNVGSIADFKRSSGLSDQPQTAKIGWR